MEGENETTHVALKMIYVNHRMNIQYCLVTNVRFLDVLLTLTTTLHNFIPFIRTLYHFMNYVLILTNFFGFVHSIKNNSKKLEALLEIVHQLPQVNKDNFE